MDGHLDTRNAMLVTHWTRERKDPPEGRRNNEHTLFDGGMDTGDVSFYARISPANPQIIMLRLKFPSVSTWTSVSSARSVVLEGITWKL